MKYFILALSTLLISACSSSEEERILPGERISIIDLNPEIQASISVDTQKNITVPNAMNNNSWPQAGGFSHHAMQNLAFGNTEQLELIWRNSIGRGTQKQIPLNARPIMADGKVFTLDTKNTVVAHHDQTGRPLWRTDISHPIEKEQVIAGGLAYDGGVLYVTSGYNEVLALNPEDGAIYWRQPIKGASRAAPTVHNGQVYIATMNNAILALDARDGKLLWDYEAIDETTGLLGDASPAADDSLVVAALSSGDLIGLDPETGSLKWQDNLANSLRFGSNLTGLSEIRGLPVIYGDAVIAVGFGGRMVVLDKNTGQRKWQQKISSAETPWVAGNTVYVLGVNHKLMAFDLISGDILWIANLPQYKDEKKRDAVLNWVGPVMGGGRIIIMADTGLALEFNPVTGAEANRWSIKANLKISPILANGALYALAENGTLLAYR